MKTVCRSAQHCSVSSDSTHAWHREAPLKRKIWLLFLRPFFNWISGLVLNHMKRAMPVVLARSSFALLIRFKFGAEFHFSHADVRSELLMNDRFKKTKSNGQLRGFSLTTKNPEHADPTKNVEKQRGFLTVSRPIWLPANGNMLQSIW